MALAIAGKLTIRPKSKFTEIAERAGPTNTREKETYFQSIYRKMNGGEPKIVSVRRNRISGKPIIANKIQRIFRRVNRKLKVRIRMAASNKGDRAGAYLEIIRLVRSAEIRIALMPNVLFG